MKQAYPIVITKGEKYYVVYVPDLEINTQGIDVVDAIEMARDAIGMWGCCQQDEKRNVPSPSPITNIEHNQSDILTLVDIDFEEYRRKHENRTIRKNLTLPSWLNEEAEKSGINFSAVLQKALKQELHIAE